MNARSSTPPSTLTKAVVERPETVLFKLIRSEPPIMRDTLGLEGMLGVIVVFLAVALLTIHDPVVGAGVMILLSGLALIAKGVADSTMRAFGMK